MGVLAVLPDSAGLVFPFPLPAAERNAGPNNNRLIAPTTNTKNIVTPTITLSFKPIPLERLIENSKKV